ncbi:MAG: low-complexity tail membrane protein [Pseudanabaena sp. M57BS1SP1A06MG]|nr:low-complexity tail membrane protein [Pseudanabaena sp. M53BS1SP1A06MG]MCA6584491.1 low-complexity tail membrane protein [Pseudanabaena sp. M34BS1SP1A06MG]MCA6591343.1 low-complexity tail membrane protein [Pseudanabaena sp. M38BS1SP1A06MG]MCA6600953.1 low-complexity tail membrane protein [Pseudanabaena sp. M57BS1SP1A06MG]
MTSPNPFALSDNNSISNHPFIWGNIAFLAGVPWLLVLSMAGLAVGDPVFPSWLEIFLLGFPAIAVVVWLQWQQPFSPFSLWFLVKPSEKLNEVERRVLTLVKQQRNGWYVTGWLAIAIAFVMSAFFCKIYIAAPLAQAIAPFPAGLRLFGIIWAEICFLLSNALLQSGVSALRIKLTAESEIRSLQPFAIEKIKNNFTNIGWQSPQLLKFFEESPISEPIEQKDVPQESTSEQTQDVVEESQNEEISDIVEETVTESNSEVVEIVESVDKNFDFNNFTEEVVSEEIEISLDAEIQEEFTPELILEISEELGTEDVQDDAIAIQEESNNSDFEVDDLVEVTTETEVNLVVTIEEPTQVDSEVVADIHDDTLEEVAEAIVNESSEEATLEIDEDTSDAIESLDVNEVVTESELEISEDTNSDDFIEPTPEEAAQAEFNDPAPEMLLDIVENAPKSELHDLVEDNFNTSSDIPDIKLDIQEDTNDVTEILEESSISEITEKSDLSIDVVPVVAKDSASEADIQADFTIERVKNSENESSDLDESLDELVTINAYLENILQDYLGDSSEDVDNENQEVEDIIEISSVSDQATEIAEEVLISEEILEAAIPELIEFSTSLETQVITQDSQKTTSENNPENKDPKFLVQEYLVNKFLASVDELNNADKTNKPNTENTQLPAEITFDSNANHEFNSVLDEFADLEAMLNTKPLSDDP